jgi:hypothetical protein
MNLYGASKEFRFVPERKNLFGIGVGISHVQLRDDLIVPLRFGGPQLSLLLNYSWFGFYNQHMLEAKAGLAPLFDRYWFISALLSFSANYCYQQRVMHDTLGNDIFLGGKLRWSMNDQSNEFWDNQHMYWFTAIDLGPALTYIHRLPNYQRLEFSIDLPGAAMVSRPPLHRYYVSDPNFDFGFFFSRSHENLKFATLNKYQAVQISVAWRRNLRKHDFVLDYQANLARTSEPKPVIIFTNSINLTWEFGR